MVDGLGIEKFFFYFVIGGFLLKIVYEGVVVFVEVICVVLVIGMCWILGYVCWVGEYGIGFVVDYDFSVGVK